MFCVRLYMPVECRDRMSYWHNVPFIKSCVRLKFVHFGYQKLSIFISAIYRINQDKAISPWFFSKLKWFYFACLSVIILLVNFHLELMQIQALIIHCGGPAQTDCRVPLVWAWLGDISVIDWEITVFLTGW